jgi:hypothetical protein
MFKLVKEEKLDFQAILFFIINHPIHLISKTGFPVFGFPLDMPMRICIVADF